MKYPKRVTVIELENAPFRGAKPAFQWATSHGVVGIMSDVDTGGKGEVSISKASVLKRFVDPNEKTKAYSYEISNIEVLKGVVGFMTRPSDRTSMNVSILLNGVCDVNGEPLLK